MTPITHTAFKYRLKPTHAQAARFAQCAGASRVAYNALTALNREILKRSWAIETELVENGMTVEQAKAEMKKRRKEDPNLQIISSFTWQKNYLTPEITRHRQAAARIEAGEALEDVWADERYAQPWFHTVPRRTFVSGADQASQALSNWMSSINGHRAGNKVGLPRFKKTGRSSDSFTIPITKETSAGGWGTPYKRGDKRHGIIEDHHHLRLSMFGTIATYNSTKNLTRLISRNGVVKSFTISRNARHWYVSLLVEAPTELIQRSDPTRAQKDKGAIGVDLGVKVKAALSTGEVVENPRHLQLSLKRLARLQTKLSRAQKGSKNRERLKNQISKLQHTISLQRASSNHHLTKTLATSYEVIGLEDLNVSGMTRSASGTIEEPGKNVAAKSGLNRNILDVSFSQIRSQLDYKTQRYGSSLLLVDRFEPTSKRCSSCGAIKKDLKLTDRTYRCDSCGYEEDRDINAAKNIQRIAEKKYKML